MRRRLKGLMEPDQRRSRLRRRGELAREIRTARAAAALQTPLRHAARKRCVCFCLRCAQWTARKTTSKWRAALTPNGASHDPLDRLRATACLALRRSFLKDAEDAGSASELHHARIEAKKLRYSLELLRPAYGERFKIAIGQIQDVQSALGKVTTAMPCGCSSKDLGGGAEIEAWLKKRQRKKTREFQPHAMAGYGGRAARFDPAHVQTAVDVNRRAARRPLRLAGQRQDRLITPECPARRRRKCRSAARRGPGTSARAACGRCRAGAASWRGNRAR